MLFAGADEVGDVSVCLPLFPETDDLIPDGLLDLLLESSCVDLFHEGSIGQKSYLFQLFRCRSNNYCHAYSDVLLEVIQRIGYVTSLADVINDKIEVTF